MGVDRKRDQSCFSADISFQPPTQAASSKGTDHQEKNGADTDDEEPTLELEEEMELEEPL